MVVACRVAGCRRRGVLAPLRVRRRDGVRAGAFCVLPRAPADGDDTHAVRADSARAGFGESPSRDAPAPAVACAPVALAESTWSPRLPLRAPACRSRSTP